mmetsp:Transcript_60079/g.127271  ORF Transcript_60079/g.127271 Transcript_60079/m.127271 type:complete len:263 (-) Transcript_60079:347-1135(-)|eukprot:CAMPEP_0206508110 /NCGR_PEP_ID=MMETSP0324_2-20121206/58088_1 /ASSEMBLY_ACC=CAM_ASM_000836 /TAXON_ID=2866 /ORGANISM="Crypthecodinium cohnii, Strain Seligo" /LENGTH=262 /DNA_ID=CAMNT_0053998813 /DNA_START=141 /DNA_END=929 /DNA_ORIENTATION=+
MAEGGVAMEDNSLIVDMVIQFMRSPGWTEPIETFINEHCTKFDNFEEENRHEFAEVHNEYKNLIDTLLTAHLLEVDIDPEDFEKRVMNSGLGEDHRFQQVVAQMAAADDFVTFKNMMVEKHAGLQSIAEANVKANDAAALEEAQRVADEADAAEAAAIAAAQEQFEASGAPPAPPLMGTVVAPLEPGSSYSVSASSAAAASSIPTPTPASAPLVPVVPSQERAFGAGGGSYGRAQAGGSRKPAGNEKANAIRQAILNGTRGR